METAEKKEERKVIRIRFTSNSANAGESASFQIGDDAGTNNASVDARLDVDGTYGTNTESIIKAMSRAGSYKIDSIKISATIQFMIDNSALNIQRTEFNNSKSDSRFDPADFTDPDNENLEFVEWKDINWLFKPTDIIQGLVFVDQPTLYLELLIGFVSI